jgi:hypothetical protein
MLLRICAEGRPFPAPGLKSVQGSPAWERRQEFLAAGVVRS